MHRSRIFRLFAFAGLLALAWIKLDPVAIARTSINAAGIGCDLRDPQSHCSAHPQFAYPVGDGLFVVLPGDFL